MRTIEPLRDRSFDVRKPARRPGDLDEPIIAELFSVERLEQHAESLATAQVTTGRPSRGRAIIPRVADNGRVLLASYRTLVRAIKDERSITPAAEWLVDNFHIVDEQLREIRDDLPSAYYQELPKLAHGHLEGYPRVFGIAWAYVAHTDSRFEAESLGRFVRAYQRVEPLRIGELWAIPISLRITLVENLRRLAELIVQARAARQKADELADDLLGLSEGGTLIGLTSFRRVVGTGLPRSGQVQLFQRLRDLDPVTTPALGWLEELVAAQGTTAEAIVHDEHQHQAAMNVTVRNAITSMRLISWADWPEFVESNNLVDEVLREGSTFGAMDFATRDRYRHAIEELARGSGHTELEVARSVVALAADPPGGRDARDETGARRAIPASAGAFDRESADASLAEPSPAGQSPTGSTDDRLSPLTDRHHDPGHYLVSDGRSDVERMLGCRVPLGRRLLRAFVAGATPGYLCTLALVTIVTLALPLVLSADDGTAAPVLLLLACLALVPASEIAIAFVHLVVTHLLGPRPVPKLELAEGVPTELRTLVVVPTFLASEAEIEAQIGQLEVRYLANAEGDIRFALLTDWLDAPADRVAGDDVLLAAATAGIDRLNARHGEAPGGGARFLLFHRDRRWNEAEGRWMGWERKRGKLHELNVLLRGSTATSILTSERGSSAPPPGVRYIITLDADTQLPIGAAARLVGAMAHPLNRPTFDAQAGRVVDGYAVLQPRITPTLPAVHDASIFQRVFSGAAGIDPYASAVSDVYQDVFGEGSYTGKGIYDIDAFERALADRTPENALLSHDLFEGTFARAGLVTDVELFDESPARYDDAAARQHRWARGDWQLLPWILGRARDATGQRMRSGIPAIDRWKMLDNLRRTLFAPAALATLIAAWTVPTVSGGLWTGFVLASMIVPASLPVLGGLLPRRRDISRRSHFRAVATDIALAAGQVALGLTFLVHQAWLMADAILRTLARLYVSRRHLLEWMTAAHAKARLDIGRAGLYRRMAGAVAVTGAMGALVLLLKPAVLIIAAPFGLLWLVSPLVARWVSTVPRASARHGLSTAEVQTLRLLGRRTWRFFETLVGPEDHHLPPDNVQEEPGPVVAHRTSPTNIGLYLLATVAARDLGWIGTIEMIERLEATLESMGRLEHLRGHLYNWYDTRDLHPLEPPYVSSVDSGNLCGHLLTIANACLEMIDRPLPVEEALAGIEDTTELTRLAAAAIRDERLTQTTTRHHLMDALAPGAGSSASAPSGMSSWGARLAALSAHATTLSDVARAITAERGDPINGELVTWAEATRLAVVSHVRDLEVLIPCTVGASAGGSITSPGSATDTGTVGADAAGPDAAFPTLSELAEAHVRTGGDGPCAAMVIIGRLQAIADEARRRFRETDFRLVFAPTRQLLSIGFRVRDGSLDLNCYDLLASEARLASFLAIAKGDIPPAHWFHLGRPLTPVGRGSALVSWSGSMFEYLMPALVMRAPWQSLLRQTYGLVVARQMSYAAERGVPWGISESAFNARDVEGTYQYSSFGVPGLGLKRGLSDDLVVAPYATALAALIEPEAAVRNFARLTEAGAHGPYGLWEALDYTRRRLPEGASVAVVKCHLAHHQGMALVAIDNVIHHGAMVERFHAEPIVQAAELLLQERMPRDVLVARLRAEEAHGAANVRDPVPPIVRRYTSPHDHIPRTHLLSNGRYAVMLTAAGSGFSRHGDLAVTRWREDVTCDPGGTYLYLRDSRSGAVWSAAYQPSGKEADSYEVSYFEDRAEFSRRDGSLATELTVVISAEDDAEIRRVSLTNLGSRSREIELTSYAEIVLASQAADVAHPAFQNLFVETEFVPAIGAILATRRPRSDSEPQVWAAHVATFEEHTDGATQYETDRGRFLGRGRSARTPMSVVDGRPLSNTVGAVLDPIFSLRRRVRLAPGASSHLLFSTVVAETREAALDLADKYRHPAAFERAATLAWTQAQVQLHHLGIEADEAHLFQRLANRILFSDPSLRPSAGLLARNDRGASGLWGLGISGDLPIVVVRIDEHADIDIVRQLLRAHEYWRTKLLKVDLVIVNEQAATYAQELQAAIETVVRTSQSVLVQGGHAAPGGVHILRGDLLSTGDRTLLVSAARAVLLSRKGTLAEQVSRLDRPGRTTPATPSRPALAPARAAIPQPAERSALRSPLGTLAEQVSRLDRPSRIMTSTPSQGVSASASRASVVSSAALEAFNGLGGFAEGGREYVVLLGPGQSTPAPWLNVVANRSFGFQVSEVGSGYTWSENSRENQLTPWSNDPVSDPVGEALYVRDDDSGELWGPTASPIRYEGSTYVARHGRGYTRFEHTRDGIGLDLVQFVPLDDSAKVSLLTVENRSGRTRHLSVTAYAEWTLGTSRGAAAPHVITALEPGTGALLARNPWNADFGGRVAFLDLGGNQTAWTADRTEFLGRNGSPDMPAGLVAGRRLSGIVGSGMDPCGVLQTNVELADGDRAELVVLLGQAADASMAADLIARLRGTDLRATLRTVADHWDDVLGGVQVKTPDRSMDIMLNGWLLYQTIACRMWARAAFYQAGGAYGFRDQLQDVLALTTAAPAMAREHLLRSAARQFPEGDVQHWWHPPSGRGVRTRISDDRLWLPYAVERYLEVTGDPAVLDEMVPFIEGPELTSDEEDAYFQPQGSAVAASLFEHCARAIDRSLAVGGHGLPLIGSGDWNDGLNRVGVGGRGESVWLGWFLYAVLDAFAPLAEDRGEDRRAERWREHMRALGQALERDGWDGDWYRRAFFDDGTPLGSVVNAECRIDSIAQSWSVLSGAGDHAHAERAMAAVEEYLVRRGDSLVLLFTPPFDHSPLSPGYIKGYLPGVRENGGQYTHGAVWSVLAFAALGDGDKAAELFSMLNPINHASSRAGVHRYKVEPYVMAADVYAAALQVGRGGWTWYTGSAGWMYQAGLDAILGFRLRGTTLVMEPCVPRAWRGYEIDFRYRSARFEIVVENPLGVSRGVASAELDGRRLPGPGAAIPLADDDATHHVRIVLG